MTQALAPHLGKCHLDAALVANHATVLHAFVLTAQALPIRYRTEDLGTKKAVALRLERPVVNRFGLGYFAMRPGPDLLRRGQTNTDTVEFGNKADAIIRAATKQGLSSCAEGIDPVIFANQRFMISDLRAGS